MTRALSDETLDAVAACGFDVFQHPNPEWRSYAYFTDGEHIGYLQRSAFGGIKLSTVHMPHPAVGTGFDMGAVEHVTRAILSMAFIHAPVWARNISREAVIKWPSINSMGENLVKVREACINTETHDNAGGGFDGSFGQQGGNE